MINTRHGTAPFIDFALVALDLFCSANLYFAILPANGSCPQAGPLTRVTLLCASGGVHQETSHGLPSFRLALFNLKGVRFGIGVYAPRLLFTVL